MRIKVLVALALALSGPSVAAPARAEGATGTGLPWLSDSLKTKPPGPAQGKTQAPPRARPAPPTPSLDIHPLSVAPLAAPDRDAAGILTAERARIDADVWQGGDSDTVIRLLREIPPSPLLGVQDLTWRLLMVEALPPDRPDDELLLARLDALLRRGALDRAQALVERAGPDTPDLFRRWFDISLLTGTEDRACQALDANVALSPSLPAEVFCMTRGGRWSTALVTLESAQGLGDLEPDDYALLSRFLDPELHEGEPPLDPPALVTPLAFRLHESIGEPLPTRDLALAFAWSDLRNMIGWKSQLEAGERLARVGAVPGNQLLGLYTQRRPAAAGALWDRVRAVQSLDLALNSGNNAVLATRVLAAQAVMQAAGLEPALAAMMAPRLANRPLAGDAAAAAARLMLFSGTVPATLGTEAPPELVLARAVMANEPLPAAEDPIGTAVVAALTGPVPKMTGGRGETILAALRVLSPNAEGDAQDWGHALSLLRAAGQDQSARRIAADILLEGGTGS